MSLEHDAQGFLTGNVLNDIRRAVDTLQDIKESIVDIKTRLMAMRFPEPVVPRRNRSTALTDLIGPTLNAQGGRIEPAVPRRRDAQGRFASDRNENNVGQASNDSANPPSPRITPYSGDIALPNGGTRRRNRRGQFAGNNNNGNDPNPNPDDENKKNKALANGIGDRIETAINESKEGLENADPVVKAFNEVATPLRNGYQVFFGGRKEETHWLKKIFKGLAAFKKIPSVFDRISRSLHNLENHAEEQAENNGGGAGFLGGLGALAAGAGKLLLKKVPILGALLTGLGVFGDINDTESDPNLTRQQKDEKNGRSIGGGIGTFGGLIGGAKLGAMAGSFLGPVGTAVGGVVGGAAGMFFGDQAGQILGEAAGFWFNELREADIPGKIMEAWDTLVKDFKTGWDDIIKKAEKAFDWFGDITDAANQYIKEKTGIDIKAKVGEAYDTVKEDFLLGWHDAVAKAKKGIEWAKENTTVGKAIARFTGDGTIRGMNKDQTKAFAEDVQRTESGGNQRAENKLGFIGSYQVGADVLADSGLVDLAKLKEAKRKSGNNWLSGGQTEFLNNSDNWLMDGGKEAFLNNIDLQNKTFLEGTNRNISVGMRSGALSRSASAEEIGAYAKAAHLGGAGGANDYFLRGKDISDINKTNLSKYANDGMMAVRNAPVATASVPSPQVPAMPPPPPIAEAPVLREPLGSGFDDRYVSLNVPQGEVGQNLSDRSIAHIVTGGIGAPV